LVNYCYQNMFRGCSSLNSITCLATDISASNCTQNWVSGVSESGVFTKANEMSGWTIDSVNGVPSGWTVQDITLPYDKQYFTLVPISAASTFQFSNAGLSYSLDSGSTWTALEASTDTPSVGVGDKIMFKGTITPTSTGIGTFSSSDKFDVEGNAMSLLYGDNFIGQTSLSGKDYALKSLFAYNKNIIKAENMILPATTLASYCYQYMFRFSSLKTAPKLLATTLVSQCYNCMFQNCGGINSITCLATDISASYCTSNWLQNASSSGTFTKAASMTSWGSGGSGIPNNWTVLDYSE